jgi:desulfoferrodoxin-like iron-binding protein
MARRKGAQYKCEECGLIVTVTEPCGCEPTCQLVCCGEPMKEVKKHKK